MCTMLPNEGGSIWCLREPRRTAIRCMALRCTRSLQDHPAGSHLLEMARHP
jgi:hypothetical protein